jgi:hypothetical protein
MSLVKLRDLRVGHQSADITFMGSLDFGLLGFGATEFSRRSFTIVFFIDGEVDRLNLFDCWRPCGDN